MENPLQIPGIDAPTLAADTFLATTSGGNRGVLRREIRSETEFEDGNTNRKKRLEARETYSFVGFKELKTVWQDGKNLPMLVITIFGGRFRGISRINLRGGTFKQYSSQYSSQYGGAVGTSIGTPTRPEPDNEDIVTFNGETDSYMLLNMVKDPVAATYTFTASKV